MKHRETQGQEDTRLGGYKQVGGLNDSLRVGKVSLKQTCIQLHQGLQKAGPKPLERSVKAQARISKVRLGQARVTKLIKAGPKVPQKAFTTVQSTFGRLQTGLGTELEVWGYTQGKFPPTSYQHQRSPTSQKTSAIPYTPPYNFRHSLFKPFQSLQRGVFFNTPLRKAEAPSLRGSHTTHQTCVGDPAVFHLQSPVGGPYQLFSKCFTSIQDTGTAALQQILKTRSQNLLYRPFKALLQSAYRPFYSAQGRQ